MPAGAAAPAACSAGDEHCCWVAGQVCPLLVEHAGGRRWACSLRLELGSWEAVHADPRYQPIREAWQRTRKRPSDCGDYPGPGEWCATCGRRGPPELKEV
jgi:hypothetical protein